LKSNHGGCIQCFAKDCPKAYHVTCAAKAGIYLLHRPEKNLAECYCPEHDSRILQPAPKKMKLMPWSNKPSFQSGMTVMTQIGGFPYEGQVIQNIPEKKR
jgi:hypothetical protein